jgi:hypothetical protein
MRYYLQADHSLSEINKNLKTYFKLTFNQTVPLGDKPSLVLSACHPSTVNLVPTTKLTFVRDMTECKQM